MLVSRVSMGVESLDMRWLRITCATRGMLMWWSGSRMITAALWPPTSEMVAVEGGRMACAMIR